MNDVQKRKCIPSPPDWFWFSDVDGCWFCHTPRACGKCKPAKRCKQESEEKQRRRDKHRKWDETE